MTTNLYSVLTRKSANAPEDSADAPQAARPLSHAPYLHVGEKKTDEMVAPPIDGSCGLCWRSA